MEVGKKVDKYEYNIKADQIMKLIDQRAFKTASKIADGIDWRRVRNINMLTNVGCVYQAVGRYTDAKEIFELAKSRAPLGRRLAYQLADVCIDSGEFDEAEQYIKEFMELAPKDTGRFELMYLLSKRKGEPIESQIAILEEFRQYDFDEKWSFELAKLYHKAGYVQKCIAACDELILWFGEGAYVDRAMELKMIYVPLSPSQQAKYNKSVRREREEEAVRRGRLKEGYDAENFQESLAKSMQEIMQNEPSEGEDDSDFRTVFSNDGIEQKPRKKHEVLMAETRDIRKDQDLLRKILEPQESEPDPFMAANLSESQNVFSAALPVQSPAFNEERNDIYGNEGFYDEQVYNQEIYYDAPVSEFPQQDRKLEYEEVPFSLHMLKENEIPDEVYYAVPSYNPQLYLDQVARKREAERAQAFSAASMEQEPVQRKNVSPFVPNTEPLERMPQSVSGIEQFKERIQMMKVEETTAQGQTPKQEMGNKASSVKKIGETEDLTQTIESLKKFYDKKIQTEEMIASDLSSSIEQNSEVLSDFFDEKIEEISEVQPEKRQNTTEIEQIEEVSLKQPELPQGEVQVIKDNQEEAVLELSPEYKAVFANYLEIPGVEQQIMETLYEAERLAQNQENFPVGNILIMGEEQSGKTTLAIDLIKTLNRLSERKGRKIARISGEKLNNRGIKDSIERLVGADLIIEQAGQMQTLVVVELLESMNGYTGGMIVVFEDTKIAIERMIAEAPQIKDYFTHEIELKANNVDAWLEVASDYAKEKNYLINEEVEKIVSSRINAVYAAKKNISMEDIEEMMNEAITKAEKRKKKGISRIFFKKKNTEPIVFQESDFS